VRTFEEIATSEVVLAQGLIRYRQLGVGEPIVLVHGLLTNSLLWAPVAQRLAQDFRVIVPDWPLGSHSVPLAPDADMSPPGLAQLIADFLDALDLDQVTLVGNDTGGALCQLVAVHHPARIGRLVLTPCDAYENFLPPILRPFQLSGWVPGMVWLVANSLRPRFAQRLPYTFEWLSKRPIEKRVMRAFLAPALGDRRIRRDLARTLRGIRKRYTLEAAEHFGDFHKPVLLAWASEDRIFKLSYAEKLAGAFPDARLERIDDSRTFVPIDQPERTASLIGEFARPKGASVQAGSR
jgi:pimeloyl-ACP methyl ester carboxylesterase